ncbi:MAG TPA: hypothetical protein VK137_17580, partial [Planctomycetaceae bacterium]|nr:hypothetical protein [Planctomycetaceae bacterium]
ATECCGAFALADASGYCHSRLWREESRTSISSPAPSPKPDWQERPLTEFGDLGYFVVPGIDR